MSVTAPALATNRNLNLDVRDLEYSSAALLGRGAKALSDSGRKIVLLGAARSPFPVPDQLVSSLRASAAEKDFLPVKGLAALRDAVAAYYLRRYRIDRTPEAVLIGPGSKELIFLLMLVYYGDLLVPIPAWSSYGNQAEILERHVQWLNTFPDDGWRVTPASLDAACRSDPTRPRILILNYPSSVTGTSYSADDLAGLAEVARRYGLIVLSDEILGELHHADGHISIARFYPEGTIVSGGLSKWCGAGGWRLGAFSFPDRLRWLQDAIANVAGETYTAVSTPIQLAAIHAYAGDPKIEQYLGQCRRILAALGDFCAKRLRRTGAKVSSPAAGLSLFCDFTPLSESLHRCGIRTGLGLCTRLLEETGVTLLPGSSFRRPSEELSARLAYVDFDGARALAAAEEVSDAESLNQIFLRTYCGNTVEAVERICHWLHNELSYC